MMRLLKRLTRVRPTPPSPPIRRAFPRLELLESRMVLYSVSGDAWPNPQLVTLSFVPDGTNLGGVTSNLFSTFNAEFGSTAAWENVILKAAQSWAQQTNINFSLVSDSGAAEGSGNYQQGDPTMGDIRISGFNFGTSTLALANMPPPANNYSIAGDITFNTGQTFSNNGYSYDLYTVAAHEIGHALGLYHSSNPAAVMYANYDGAKSGLTTDDINGIRNIYSSNAARSYDAFGGTNTSFATAANLSSLIGSNGEALADNLDLASTSFQEYFVITVPSPTNTQMFVTLQSQGLSLLAPVLTVYTSSKQVRASVSGAGQYGTTLTLHIAGAMPGQQYYIEASGADSSPFSTGNYALAFGFTGSMPTVPLPNTQVVNGDPLQDGGGMALSTQNSFFHGAGCNCPACRAARAALQQQLELRQVLMVASQKEQDKNLASAAHARTTQEAVVHNANSQAAAQLFVFVSSAQQAGKQAPTVPVDQGSASAAGDLTGLVLDGASQAAASWKQSSEALFAAGMSSSTTGPALAAGTALQLGS
jgi:hypothetical protein